MSHVEDCEEGKVGVGLYEEALWALCDWILDFFKFVAMLAALRDLENEPQQGEEDAGDQQKRCKADQEALRRQDH